MVDLAGQASSIGALAEPVRRALYEYVATQADPVSREQAASAVDVPAHTAKFHLDKLVDEGLLETEFRRLSGRTGPGAGRPSKLYQRSAREFAVSLPERHYDLVGHILASAVEQAARGTSLDDALSSAATEHGRVDGQSAESGVEDPLDRLAETLSGRGYEARREDDTVTLANCPFDSLAKQHTELVCGLNRDYVQGVADGLGCTGVEACLEPEDGLCCVKSHRR
ncbi:MULTISPECIES: helix-turn-helix transcriptional regulator [unclassified Nocardioides]|uniref:helix-turn-helix transcriptional regulator n=1 Tax=unclassified Nocardioides TaxID=2615069 RepID=UPI000AACA39B|nr:MULTISPECIES: helix-turn-helix domain-containing protein [unclassified Nocardioides]